MTLRVNSNKILLQLANKWQEILDNLTCFTIFRWIDEEYGGFQGFAFNWQDYKIFP